MGGGWAKVMAQFDSLEEDGRGTGTLFSPRQCTMYNAQLKDGDLSSERRYLYSND